MTNDELNAKAAEIMGLRHTGSTLCYANKDNFIVYTASPHIYGTYWNPCENIAQAFELKDRVMKLISWRFHYIHSGKNESCATHYAWFGIEKGLGSMESASKAITVACVAAWEKKK